MIKIALTILFTILPISGVFALTPTAADLTATARQVRTQGTPLLLNVTHTFDVVPDAKCIVRLYGKLTSTDGTYEGRTVRLMTKSSLSKRVRFLYRGPSARLSNGLQKQLNVQTLSTCSGRRIKSVAAAANVTCIKGVEDSAFVRLVRERLRGAFMHRVAENSSESC